MNLRLNSLGQMARALLGHDAGLSVEIQAGDEPPVTEGEAATAPAPEADVPPQPAEETEMPEANLEAAIAAATAEATVAATQAANARWKAVLSHEAAEGRMSLAVSLLSKDLSAEDVIEVLAAAPAPAELSTFTRLEQRMADEPNPDVKANEPSDSKPENHQAGWDAAIQKTRGSLRK